MEGVVHSLKKNKKNNWKVKSSAVVSSILSSGQNVCVCVCVWQYCHNSQKVMFYIYKYNTYINILKCLLYGYALNVCTESWRASGSEQNDRRVKSPQQKLREEVSKKTFVSKKNKCVNYKCFQTVTVWWRESTFLAFISNHYFFIYIYFHLMVM